MKHILNPYFLAALLSFSQSHADELTTPMAAINAWGYHYGGAVYYRYQVKNLGSRAITSLAFGSGIVGGEGRELNVGPDIDGQVTFMVPPRTAMRPKGWAVRYLYQDESEKFALLWYDIKSEETTDALLIPSATEPPSIAPSNTTLPPGVVWDSFTVKLKEADPAYVNAHVWITDDEDFQIMRVTKGDTIPPEFTLSARRVDQPIGRHDWAEFHIDMRVRDNYDPHPEVKLEPPSPFSTMRSEDMKVTELHGHWIVKLRQIPGNTYKLDFGAADASGNKTIRSFEFTVPGKRHY